MAVWIKPLHSLFSNRQLYWELLVRDILTNVRGSMLGLAWVLITPLVLVAIYTFVFGVVLKSTWIGQTESPLEVPLIYFLGLVTFSFFFEIITRSPEFIRSNKTYVTKIVFPVDILAWVVVGTSAMKLLASIALLAVFMVLVMGHLPVGLLLLPVIYLPLLFLCTGLAWILNAIGTYVRDLYQFLLAIAPVFMFVSPIFYSIEQVPSSARAVFWFNPLTFVLENARAVLFFDGRIDWTGYLSFWAGALLVFFAGYAFFQKARRGFADVI